LAALVVQVEKLAAHLGRKKGVQVEMEQIGNRPAGEIAAESPLVTWATQALRQVGCDSFSLLSGSTDANIPISQGYPAVCIGLANAGNTHRIDPAWGKMRAFPPALAAHAVRRIHPAQQYFRRPDGWRN
jgi:hypothetical protein